MVRVYRRANSFVLTLPCAICQQPLRLQATWLVFPSRGDTVPGEFVHKTCIDGKCRELFGQDHVVMMRGAVALTNLAKSLEGPVEVESHQSY
jgi:hypothetical protein